MHGGAGQPDRWSLGRWSISGPAFSAPRFAATGRDLGHQPATSQGMTRVPPSRRGHSNFALTDLPDRARLLAGASVPRFSSRSLARYRPGKSGPSRTGAAASAPPARADNGWRASKPAAAPQRPNALA